MLDIPSNHSTSSYARQNSNTPEAIRAGGKRIPASLIKMRRASLATTKYSHTNLPGRTNSTSSTVSNASSAEEPQPDNSLSGLLAAKLGTTNTNTTSSSALPAFCTPRRTTPKTLGLGNLGSLGGGIGKAASFLAKTDLSDMCSDINPVMASNCTNTPSLTKSSSLRNIITKSNSLRNIVTDNNNHHCKDMESLLKSGLATPRRTAGRPSLASLATGIRIDVDDLLADEPAIPKSKPEGRRSSMGHSSSPGAKKPNNNKAPARRSNSMQSQHEDNLNALTSKDMDALMKSGLATPRRARRSVVMTSTHTNAQQQKRMSKWKNKAPALLHDASLGGSSSSSSNHDRHTAENTTKTAISPKNPRCTRKPARRHKSVDATTALAASSTTDSAPKTPGRRASRAGAPGGPLRRVKTMQPRSSSHGSSSKSKKHVEESPPLSQPPLEQRLEKPQPACEDNVSSCSVSTMSDDHTPIPAAPPPTPTTSDCWKCQCGEDNDACQNFCGFCGTRKRWECADCGFANKCKFVFCGMCGISKKLKGSSAEE